ncbi:MAG: rsmC [Caulobacteraceae bacterium]|nr:rsmC [Caulobacteraceae bacterium]
MTSSPTPTAAVYGAPPRELAERERAAVQVSPLVPGAAALEDFAPGSLSEVVMLAPPGTVERRYAVALALRALAPGAALTVMAPKDRGGSRLKKELEAFGCAVDETAKRHHRICVAERPAAPVGLDGAVADGAPRRVEALQLWSQPGVFSWDRIDPGTALLLKQLPALAGKGADLGCGVGVLARAVLAAPGVTRLDLIDNDRRAVDAARRNIDDPRAAIAWADATGDAVPLEGLDFVVMNPPFHDGGTEDKALGQRFIQRAHQALRKGGTLWLVANMHLPYEPILTPLFAKVERRADGGGGYKVFEARK